jgi:hypothetical protein
MSNKENKKSKKMSTKEMKKVKGGLVKSGTLRADQTIAGTGFETVDANLADTSARVITKRP